jgi:hypothetical protein
LSRAQASQHAAQELTSIAAELNVLMRQFKIERSDRRYMVALPVQLTATDVNGHTFDHEVTTVDISHQGASLKGIRVKLPLDSVVKLSRLHKVEEFLVAWVGDQNTPKAGHIGVSAIDPATSFWNDAIETHSQAELPTSAPNHSKRFSTSSEKQLTALR